MDKHSGPLGRKDLVQCAAILEAVCLRYQVLLNVSSHLRFKLYQQGTGHIARKVRSSVVACKVISDPTKERDEMISQARGTHFSQNVLKAVCTLKLLAPKCELVPTVAGVYTAVDSLGALQR